MLKQSFLTLILSALSVGFVQADTYEWSEGYAQGVTEYAVDDGNGNGLIIACPSDPDAGISAIATIAGRDHSSDSDIGFDVIVDGETYSNPFFTECNVCAENFPYFWKALRQANNIQVVADGKQIKLPTKGLQSLLLPLDAEGNSCRSAW